MLNRALMGSNMQRQAVPLLITEAPVVGTGMEEKQLLLTPEYVLSLKKEELLSVLHPAEIQIKQDDGKLKKYKLTKFQRSNQSNCYNQRAIVFKGDRVEKPAMLSQTDRLHLTVSLH